MKTQVSDILMISKAGNALKHRGIIIIVIGDPFLDHGNIFAVISLLNFLIVKILEHARTLLQY